MKKLAFASLCVMLSASNAFADDVDNSVSIDYERAKGWQFYNLPQKPKEQTRKMPESVDQLPEKELSPTQQMKLIQEKMQESKDKAIMNPTPENIAVYKVYQDYFVRKASEFSAKWEQMLLEYPDLDHNLKSSHYNATAPIQEAENRKKQNEAIDYVKDRYGVFFFYRGNNALDNELSKVIKRFSEGYGLTVMPISIDGRFSPEFPNSRVESGQAEKMKIKHFPALFLVDPKSNVYKPLSYGFITQDDLARRVFNVIWGFQAKD